MRILHLVDPGSPGGGACTLRTIAEVTTRLHSIQHEVLILGTAPHRGLAERCDVPVTGHLGLPTGWLTGGRRPLRRVINDFQRAGGAFDLVHAWTPRSAVLAALAAPHHRRLGTFSIGPVTGVLTPLLVALLEHRPMPILAASAGVREEFRSMGLPRRLISLLPPGINPDSFEPTPREAVRERWAVDPSTLVVGMLSEPVNWADAEIAAIVISRLALSGRDVRLVVHHEAHRRPHAERWLQQLELRHLVVSDDEAAEPWNVVAGLDAALLIGGELNAMNLRDAGSPFSLLIGGGRRLRPMPSVLPLLWAMAAGVPVIAESSVAVRDIVEDGVSGLLVAQGDTNAVCDRLMHLHDDRTIAGRVGGAAAEHVREDFHIAHFCVRLKQAYDLHLAGHTVRVIPEPDDPIVEHANLDEPLWVIR